MKFLAISTLLLLCSCSPLKRSSEAFTAPMSFTEGVEGPAVGPDGKLYAVNFARQGTIGVVDEKGKANVFLELPGESVGNGIRFDRQGNMFIADYVGHRVYRVAAGETQPEVWVEEPRMYQPNDLVVANDGSIYLSDPNWKEGSGQIWRVSPDKTISLLEAGMGTTNGIELSPDGKTLYVNESVQLKVWKYRVLPSGLLTDKTLLVAFNDYGLDGMRCDHRGNLYITRYGKGTVAIIDPQGKLIREVSLQGKKPSNITFGGKNGKQCFVTMADRGNIEVFKADVAGSHFTKIH